MATNDNVGGVGKFILKIFAVMIVICIVLILAGYAMFKYAFDLIPDFIKGPMEATADFIQGKVKARSSYIPNCPNRYTTTGRNDLATGCFYNNVSKSAPSILKDCPDGYKNSGFGTCIPRVMGRGAGVVGSKVKTYGCPSHTPNHHGVWGAGWCDNGPTWPWDLDTSEETYTWKAQRDIPYSLSPGNELPDPGEGKRVWVKSGLLFYPQCPSGMTADTANICRTKGPTTRTDFKPCKTGYKNHTAGRCRVDCERKYGKGFENTGEHCNSIARWVPWSELENPCKTNEVLMGGLCYKQCPTDTKPVKGPLGELRFCKDMTGQEKLSAKLTDIKNAAERKFTDIKNTISAKLS